MSQVLSDSSTKPMAMPVDGGAPRLVDRFGRVHDALRISVTDRCNIRCFYCMPAGEIPFLEQDRLLTFDQIARIVRALATVGIRKLRITGGEPLMRPRLEELVRLLSAIDGIETLALTTNGMLLEHQAQALCDAGLQRINISLDTLREETFQRISRRPGLDRVLRGIDAAIHAGFEQIRLNALALRHLSEDEIVPLTEFALDRGLHLRFIEYMPLDADHQWSAAQVLSGDAILQRLAERFGSIRPIERDDPSQPAQDFAIGEHTTRIGIIRPVTAPFCGSCNRLRLTAEGSLRNCLFSMDEWNVRDCLAASDDQKQLITQVRACLDAKLPGHLIARDGFQQPARAMYQIGG